MQPWWAWGQLEKSYQAQTFDDGPSTTVLLLIIEMIMHADLILTL